MISWSIFLVQSGGSGSASISLSHGVRRGPPTPAPKEEEAEVAPDSAIETPDDPSDRAEPDTRLPDITSDGLGLSKLSKINLLISILNIYSFS